MNKNAGVQEYLDYYLSASADLEFGIMICGGWGSGKTHFIKNYFTERESRLGKSAGGGPSYLYASLYGVRSPSEITDQFFSQCNPLIGSKAARVLGSLAARVANVFSGSDAVCEGEDKSLIQQILLNLEGKALIFDDLERCAMPIVDVMGFINSYVEHDGLKVIIIASEEDIPAEQMEEYKRRKEKLVGKTLQVYIDAQMVLEHFCGGLTNPSVIESIKEVRDALLRTFDASHNRNFRSLRSILFDFERLVSFSDERLKKSKEAMKRLLLYALATALEYRAGRLRQDDLDKKSILMRLTAASLGEINKTEMPIERLRATYKEVDWSDPIIPNAALFKLFETGLVEMDLINLHLEQHPLIVGIAEAPVWRQLWNWEEIPQAQFNSVYARFTTELKQRAFTNPGLILHVAGICISMESFGANLLNGMEATVFFRQYLIDIDTFIEPDIAVFEQLTQSYFALGYRERDTQQFQDIYIAVRDSTYKAHSRQISEVANGFIDAVESNPDLYFSLIGRCSGGPDYSSTAFLHNIPPQDFAAMLIKDGVIKRELCHSLCVRYQIDSQRRCLRSEYEWLSQLKHFLKVLAKKVPPPHGPSLERGIEDLFAKVSGHLKV